ncbi:type VI secretion protein IcmF/TssM N-terminal domain-containing protein [Candidatus Laterigemmans baculatus]|uniref:type VI secretion protein IcmF/TssM N-terminal domain-containing protein n=1 Tax=Candidatus Laterigemmans baculatus TaxID=2770505 RepID=UPI0013DA3910|nr:type VI secretion protein IcmF/TssM N-terminal domain-containing protein [Candidatus Laterigemmans baculatus]
MTAETVSPNLDAAPNVDAAWQTVLEQIRAAGIELQRTPLFLTLGRPSGGLAEFCSVLPLDASLPLPAGRDDPPLAVYGNQEGLFVCCGKNSLFGDYLDSQQISAGPISELTSAATSLTTASSSDPLSPPASAAPPSAAPPSAGSPSSGPASPVAVAAAAERNGGTATLVRPQTSSPAAPRLSEMARSIETQLDELEHQLAEADALLAPETAVATRSTAAAAGERFAQLCRLISAAREPYCPINGVVVLIPLEVLGSDEATAEGASCIQQDLQIALRSLETEVSVQIVFSGLAASEGGDELLDRLAEDQLFGTLGCVLPLPPEGDGDAAQRATDQAAAWLCDGLFPALARRVLRRGELDAPNDHSEHSDHSVPSDRAAQAGNRRLHALVAAFRGRRQRLSRLLAGCLPATPGQWRIRGCFFAPTSSQRPPTAAPPTPAPPIPDRQAFAAGILMQIQRMQNEVRWLASRRRRDSLALAATLVGYALILTATLATAALVCG